MVSPTESDVEPLIEDLRYNTSAFVETVGDLDPDLQIPNCPEWRLRDLVAHIDQAPRWAAAIIRSRQPAAVPNPRDADPGAPGAWPGWLLGGVTELVDAVRDAGAETMVWTVVGPQPAAFWLRRMLHDTALHHVDAALAAGTMFEIDPNLAADAITEGLQLLSLPEMATLRPDVAELRGRGQTLQLLPGERSSTGWLITRTPDGVSWQRGKDDADVTVAGTTSDLLLILTRRLPLGDHRVTVTGNRALMDHWLADSPY